MSEKPADHSAPYLNSYKENKKYDLLSYSPDRIEDINIIPVGCLDAGVVSSSLEYQDTDPMYFSKQNCIRNIITQTSDETWKEMKEMKKTKKQKGLVYKIAKMGDEYSQSMFMGLSYGSAIASKFNSFSNAINDPTNQIISAAKDKYETEVKIHNAQIEENKKNRERSKSKKYDMYVREGIPITIKPDVPGGKINFTPSWYGVYGQYKHISEKSNQLLDKTNTLSVKNYNSTYGDPYPGKTKLAHYNWISTPPPVSQIPVDPVNSIKQNVEWFGYFKPDIPGKFTFSVSCAGKCHIWIGDNALYEYNTNSTSFSENFHLTFGNGKSSGSYHPQQIKFLSNSIYYPIRIHYCGIADNNPFRFSLIVTNEHGKQGNYFYTIYDEFGQIYKKKPAYAAFISGPNQTYQYRIFYGNDICSEVENMKRVTSPLDCGGKDAQDKIVSTSMSENNTISNYFLYRIPIDLRYNKIFQIESLGDPIKIKPIDEKMISYKNNYHQYPEMYPIHNSGDLDLSQPECEKICNDNEFCSHYFSYLDKDQLSKCKLGYSTNNLIYLQQAPNSDVNSSTLYMRDKYVDEIEGCHYFRYRSDNNKKPALKKEIKTATAGDYTASYNMDTTPLKKKSMLAVCGDKVYRKKASILKKDNRNIMKTQLVETFDEMCSSSDYTMTNGKYQTATTGKVCVPKKCGKDAKFEYGVWSENGYVCLPADETTKSKKIYNIPTIKTSADKFPKTMDHVQEYQEKIKTDLQHYEKNYNIMINDSDYDYNTGFIFDDQTVSRRREDVNLEDTKKILIQQNTTYMVGVITAATLLIAGIMIGSRE